MEPRALGNLQNELREELLVWALLPHGIIGAILAVLDWENVPPPSRSALGMLLLILVGAVLVVRMRHYRLAAWLMNLGTLGIIVLTWDWFPNHQTQYALVFPIVGAAVTLGVRASLILTGLASLAVGWHVANGSVVGNLSALSAITENLGMLWSTAFLVCIAQHPWQTMLMWAWQGYEQARHNLEQARDRQVELKQAIEDLALASAETVRLNDMLSSARRAVEEARRAKEEFVATVSHELRTPLNMIIGFSDMILESPEVYARRLPPALLVDVAAIRRNSEQLASLVDDVLDLSEVDAGRAQLFREWGSLHAIVRDAAEAVDALYRKKGLALNVEDLTALPPVYCDRTRIRQVILNLLSNAGRFTEKGSVRVGATLRDNLLTLSVADTGPGVPPEKLGRLFEPFQQGDASLRRRYGGSGLGLTISKRFVEMHGGKIWLESQVGDGTTVSFTLPVYSERAEDTPQRWLGPGHEYLHPLRRSTAPEVKPKQRVAVVERGEALSKLIARYLEGTEPLRVGNPIEAGQAVEKGGAIAVVVNEMSSTTTTAASFELDQVSFDVPIISCWVPEPQATYGQMGAQEYLVKPISREELLGSIERIAPTARTILLADDDVEARQLLGRMIASAGRNYTLLQADDGASTLDLMRTRHPDLLLLDLVMPLVDGFSVLEQKALDAEINAIPVIIVSAKDPQRQPILSKTLLVTRQEGLSVRDLMLALEAIVGALKPRFASSAQPETPRA